MQRLDALIFDLEGTLLDSSVDIRQGLNLMLAEDGRPPLSPEQAKACMAEGMMETCQHALEATGGVQGDDIYPYVKRFVGHYRGAPPDPAQIYPFVRETLEKFKNSGVKIALCTNKSEEASVKQLKALGLIDAFAFIAGGDTFMVHKPNPGHVTGILDALGVAPEHALFVGDNRNDVIAAKKAGVRCIIITHGKDGHGADFGADRIIAELDELDVSGF